MIYTENIKAVRKQFVFLLNYALDISKKNYIEADDLVLFSTEVKKFQGWLKTIELPENISEYLEDIHFDYSVSRKDFSDSLFLFLRYTPLSWIQQTNRRKNLNNFLDKYDKYLKLFD